MAAGEPVRMRPLPRVHAFTDAGDHRCRRFRHPCRRDRRGRSGRGVARARPDRGRRRRSPRVAQRTAGAGPPARSGSFRERPAGHRRGHRARTASSWVPATCAGRARASAAPWLDRALGAHRCEARTRCERRGFPARGQHLRDRRPTRSGPGQGLGLVRDAAALGRPVIAIGGITPERAPRARERRRLRSGRHPGAVAGGRSGRRGAGHAGAME